MLFGYGGLALGLVLNNPSTYLKAFMDYNFLQIAFNIILLLPFGVYLRYYFERKWYQVFLLSFAYSLFFELTQLSGLYGIYPHPYRWFEVDDLICNTLGGMLGFLLTPLFSFFLPSKDRLDELSYKKGHRVSIIRRGLANIIDWSIVSLALFLIKTFLENVPYVDKLMEYFNASPVYFAIVSIFIYFVIISWIMAGKTIGKTIVSLQVNRENGQRARLYQYIIRYGMIYLVFVPTPIYVSELLRLFQASFTLWQKLFYGFEMAILVSTFLYTIAHIFISTIFHHSQLLYDRISHTSQVSVVIVKDEDMLIDEDNLADEDMLVDGDKSQLEKPIEKREEIEHEAAITEERDGK